MSNITEPMRCQEPHQRLGSKVVNMNPIEIVQELPTLMGRILERIRNFNIKKPVFS
jgi:hypothetical protein